MSNENAVSSTLFLGHNADWWDFWLIVSVVFAAMAATAIGVTTAGSIVSHSREAQAADERAAKLVVELEHTKSAAKQIDFNLLHEQRLTANERWRLGRIERAVLPRSIFVNWGQLAEDLRAGQFKPINLGVLRAPEEAHQFGNAIAAALQTAGLLKTTFDLPPSTNDSAPTQGLSWFFANEHADALSEMLWRKYQIGGGGGPFFPHSMPPEWQNIPTSENLLVVGANDAAMQPGSGQAGEGLDVNGRPVPAP